MKTSAASISCSTSTVRALAGSGAPRQRVAAPASAGSLQSKLNASPRQIAQLRRAAQVSTRSAPGPVVQRTEQLADKYPNAVSGLSEAQKKQRLADYQKIRDFLTDKSQVLPHLQALNDKLVSKRNSLPKPSAKGGPSPETPLLLSQTLAEKEGGTWQSERPFLIGFVPSESFRDVVAQGEAFEDTVTQGHGSQSHRLQWYLIQEHNEQKSGWLHEPVIDLYKEIVHDRWQRPEDGKRLWDSVIDGSNTKIGVFDFTNPEGIGIELRQPEYAYLKELVGELASYDSQVDDTLKRYRDYWAAHTKNTDPDKIARDHHIKVGQYVFTGFKRVSPAKWNPTIVYEAATFSRACTSIEAYESVEEYEGACCTIL